MTSFNKVMIATDFSPAAERLSACLFELCPDTGTTVVLTHVLAEDEDADPHSPEGKQLYVKLRRYEEDCRRAGYENITVLLPSGEPNEVIAKAAEELEIDLLLVASHGKGFLRSTFLGSTTFDLAKTAKCPLFVDRYEGEEGMEAEPRNLLKRILVPTDFSKESLGALNIIRNLRDQIEEVVFVYVIEKNRKLDDFAEQKRKAELQLSELAEEVKVFGVHGFGKVAKGIPSKKLQKVAEEFEATMIVMAKTGAGRVQDLLLGSTAQNLALNIDIPILLLPDLEEN